MNTPITGLAPASRSAGRAADPAGNDLQREFARLSHQVAQAEHRLHAWREAPDALAARVASGLSPAMAEQRDAEHGLAIQLDALLESPPKGLRLGGRRRVALITYLLDLCRSLLAHGHDDTLLTIHDRHSQRSHAALERDARQHTMTQALAMLDGAFGRGAVRPLPGESDDAFLARAEHRLFEAYEAERAREDAARARRAERRTARKAARDAAKTGAATKRGQGGKDRAGPRSAASGRGAGTVEPAIDAPFGPSAADTPPGTPGRGVAPPSAPEDTPEAEPGTDATPEDRLRALYRRLASALHPDRAPDGEARAHRTVQMTSLNAAWESRDLLAMLALQAEAFPNDQTPPALPEALARDYIALLQGRLDRLKAEARSAADAATPPDIAIARGRPREPAQLMQWLEMDVQRLRRNAAILRGIAEGLTDPDQRRDVVDTLLERAEAELMCRALDQFIGDLAGRD